MPGQSIKPKKGSSALHEGDDGLPSFDEKALSALTERIEEGLGKSQASQQQSDPVNRSHHKAGKEGSGLSSAKITSKTKTQGRGTKRDSQGKAKVASQGNAKSQSGRGDHISRKGKDDRAVLLQEILALGGNEDDLDLVADTISEGEDEDSRIAAPPDKSLRQDLAKFVADLGIEGNLEGASSASEADEGAEDEWQEIADLDSQNASDGLAESESNLKISGPALPDALLSKDPNRLVSTLPALVICLTYSS
jgi:ribosome biogenesis protein MAK21